MLIDQITGSLHLRAARFTKRGVLVVDGILILPAIPGKRLPRWTDVGGTPACHSVRVVY